jgi:hypothetical protein
MEKWLQRCITRTQQCTSRKITERIHPVIIPVYPQMPELSLAFMASLQTTWAHKLPPLFSPVKLESFAKTEKIFQTGMLPLWLITQRVGKYRKERKV